MDKYYLNKWGDRKHTNIECMGKLSNISKGYCVDHDLTPSAFEEYKRCSYGCGDVIKGKYNIDGSYDDDININHLLNAKYRCSKDNKNK